MRLAPKPVSSSPGIAVSPGAQPNGPNLWRSGGGWRSGGDTEKYRQGSVQAQQIGIRDAPKDAAHAASSECRDLVHHDPGRGAKVVERVRDEAKAQQRCIGLDMSQRTDRNARCFLKIVRLNDDGRARLAGVVAAASHGDKIATLHDRVSRLVGRVRRCFKEIHHVIVLICRRHGQGLPTRFGLEARGTGIRNLHEDRSRSLPPRPMPLNAAPLSRWLGHCRLHHRQFAIRKMSAPVAAVKYPLGLRSRRGRTRVSDALRGLVNWEASQTIPLVSRE